MSIPLQPGWDDRAVARAEPIIYCEQSQFTVNNISSTLYTYAVIFITRLFKWQCISFFSIQIQQRFEAIYECSLYNSLPESSKNYNRILMGAFDIKLLNFHCMNIGRTISGTAWSGPKPIQTKPMDSDTCWSNECSDVELVEKLRCLVKAATHTGELVGNYTVGNPGHELVAN